MKFDYKPTGPYMLSNIINKNAYKLAMPRAIWNANISHMLLLDS